MLSVYFDNQDLESNIRIFPNPVRDVLTIVNAQGKAILYNALGQVVKRFRINNVQSEIDVNDLPRGPYLIQIQQQEGYVQTLQFIK